MPATTATTATTTTTRGRSDQRARTCDDDGDDWTTYLKQ
jgi:hypothetical protein